MPNVRVVTDSAADLPAALASSRGIKVVPLTIRFGPEEFVDGVELTTTQFWEKLRSSTEHPATAAPSAGAFEEVFRGLIAEGADGIVCVTLSSKLSATYQAAVLAARAIPEIDVEVVDSLGVTAHTGLMALRAADLAEHGATAKEIAEELIALRPRMRLCGVLDTLEYLRRGGRIGGAQALLGTMLQVKPVIGLVDGAVEPAGRVRTRQKALHHLANYVRAGEVSGEVIVVNGEAADLDAFLELIPAEHAVAAKDVWNLGPVVGSHTGPGLIGVVYVAAG